MLCQGLYMDKTHQKLLKAIPLRRAMTGVLVTVLLAIAWGFIEPHVVLDTERVEAAVPGLPASWDGQEVAFLSDIQLGLRLTNGGTARDAVRALVEDPPAAVLLGGDFVYTKAPDVPHQVETVADMLRPLADAGIPTYAVLGNHDLAAGAADRLRDAFDDLGFTMLHNSAAELSLDAAGSSPLWFVGVGPHIPGQDRPREALADVPDDAARVAFMHNPDSFEAFPAETAPLAVAGHTHGGQIRPVPFLPDWSALSLLSEDEITADGWISGYGAPGNSLYVSRGIGMSIVPIRFNCPPELTRLTLRRA